MPIKRLLSGRDFAPQSVKVLTHVYENALASLTISADDAAAKERLAKLILDIAAPKSTLSVEGLLTEVLIAWAQPNSRTA